MQQPKAKTRVGRPAGECVSPQGVLPPHGLHRLPGAWRGWEGVSIQSQQHFRNPAGHSLCCFGFITVKHATSP